MGKLGELLTHPHEFLPMASMFMAARRAKHLPKEPGLAFCYDMLNRVSRSFAVVIQQLPLGLRDAVCVFYLVLRALDTVEDDMSLDKKIKVPLLLCFHEKSYDRSWKMSCGSGEYVRLMENYPLVTDVFLRLDKRYQEVIADICKKMGAGMAEFVTDAVADSEVASVKDYNLYCHYVAGLVGIGLSHLFASSGLESEAFYHTEDGLANEMGLFLQKTNIIRDYLEDINEEPRPRMWWPRDIWGKYADALEDLKDPEQAAAAVQCLNHMITDALGHVESCLDYMFHLRQPNVFRFCAIPQIMAIGTLSMCYNNHDVFTGVLKMRRGEVARVMYRLDDYGDLCGMFHNYAEDLKLKAEKEAEGDPNQQKMVQLCSKIMDSCNKRLHAMAVAKAAEEVAAAAVPMPLSARLAMFVMALAYVVYAYRIESVRAWLEIASPKNAASPDRVNVMVATTFFLYAVFVLVTGKKL